MQVGIAKSLPPHIRFTTIAVENRNASIEAGHKVFENEDHVVITPQGSKDSVTKPVKEWLASSDRQVQEERLPAEWAEKFHNAYAHWKRGEEIPVDGIPLVVWPAISPAEIASCKSIHITTVEELAQANDESLRRLGMGGLELKKRALKFLDISAGPGKLLAANKALEEKLNASEARREELEVRLTALEARVGTSPVKVSAPAEDTVTRKL